MGLLARFVGYLTRVSRYCRAVAAADRSLLARRFLLLACDGFVLALSFWGAFALRLNAIFSQAFLDSLLLLPVLLIVGLLILWTAPPILLTAFPIFQFRSHCASTTRLNWVWFLIQIQMNIFQHKEDAVPFTTTTPFNASIRI